MESCMDLSNKSLRTRIDGINFTYIETYKELVNQGIKDQLEIKRSILVEYASKLREVFKFDQDSIDFYEAKFVLDLNKDLGVFVESYFKNQNCYLCIQFKGSFFIEDHAFYFCRELMTRATEVFNAFFRVTLVDIAQDFLVPIQGVFPDPHIWSEDYRYCFKFKFANYRKQSPTSTMVTGYSLMSGRYKITVYDKIEENAGAKNPQKKEYYSSLYEKYSETGVTRVELRLKQELCKFISNTFYQAAIDELTFIRFSLKQFFNRHKLRVRPKGSKDSFYKRWPVHSNWKFIFEGHSESSQITSPDFRYTSPNTDITRPLSLFMDAIVADRPEITREEVISILEKIDYDEFIKKSRQRSLKTSRTRAIFNSYKDELLAKRRSGDWLDPDIGG